MSLLLPAECHPFCCVHPWSFDGSIHNWNNVEFNSLEASSWVHVQVEVIQRKLATYSQRFRARETRHTWKTAIISWIEVIIRSSVAPAAWLFVVFLDGG